MMRSLSSAVAGLRTHQTKMDVIGNNIANVNTYGFKASRVTFSDVYYQTTGGGSAPAVSNPGTANESRTGGINPTQIGYGAQVATIDVLNSPSGAAATNRPLDVYLTGEGYITSKKGDETFYTRLGNLKFDVMGNLVDHTGNIVQGFEVTASGGVTNMADVPNEKYDPNLASLLDIKVELEAALGSIATPGSPTPTEVARIEGLYAALTDSVAINKIKETADRTAYETAVTAWDIDFAAMQTASYSAGDVTTMSASLTGATMPALASKTVPQYVGDHRDVNDPLLWQTVIDPELEQTESMLRGINLGLDIDVLSILTNINVDKSGRITGILTKDYTSSKYGMDFFANETYTIGQLAMANFGNSEGLVQAGNNYFQIGPNSGDAIYTIPGKNGTGEVKAGYLEMSNVDISQEFTDMITTQRGFQANTRIITVSDEMLQELVNLKR